MRIREAQTTSGILSTIASLLVLCLYWKLRRRLLREGNFLNLIVLLMTCMQFVQDCALMMHMNCLTNASDDDAFWTESGSGYSFKRCQRATWFLNQSSGIMLQMLGIEMSVFVLFVVVYQRHFDYFKLTKYWLSFSAIVAIVGASVNPFGAVKCAKKVSKTGILRNYYTCPEPPVLGPQYQLSPQNMVNYWSVNAVGFRFCENLRTSAACLSLMICVWAFREFWEGSSKGDNPTKVVVYRQLVNRIIWYPIAQSGTRLAAMYTNVFGGIQNVNRPIEPEDLYYFRIFCGYIQSIFVPSGGIFMLVIFIRNNQAARKWLNETWAMITNRCFQEQESLNDVFSLREVTSSSGSSGAQGVENTMLQVNARCSMMDEDELIQKVVANRHASEQEWSEAFLAERQHHRGSFINRRMSGLRRSRGGSVSSEVDGSIESGNFELIAQHSLRRPSSFSERPLPPPPPHRRGSDSASSSSLSRPQLPRLSIADSGGGRRQSRSSGSFSPNAEHRRSRSGSLGRPSPESPADARGMRRFSFRVDNPLASEEEY